MNRDNPKIFDFVKHEEKVDRLLRSSPFRAHMSNSKWRRAFEALDTTCPDLQVIWKFVGAKNDGVRHALPSIQALEERHLNSWFWFGPAYYKEIEWIEFPRMEIPYGKERVSAAHSAQDIESARHCLERIGHFRIVETDLGFRLYGYE